MATFEYQPPTKTRIVSVMQWSRKAYPMRNFLMSHTKLWVYDEKIRMGITTISGLSGDDKAKIPDLCRALLNQIADRNDMVKALK